MLCRPRSLAARLVETVLLIGGCAPATLTAEPPGHVLAARDDGWPWLGGVHPAVAEMPAEREQSIAAVGRWIADEEPDPTLRIKAIHDWVATRIAYDLDAADEHFITGQDAEHVFANRRGVCLGFANLAVALGTAAGLDIVEIEGDVRASNADPVELHAWNAARIGDRWVLFDATWDAGAADDTFLRSYGTEYLMPPPAIFAATHYPEDERWLLLATPMSHEQWLDGLAMPPAFFARGLALRRATRQGTESARIELDNPLGLDLSAAITEAGTTLLSDCLQVGALQDPELPKLPGDPVGAAFRCPLHGRGDYLVMLWNDGVWLGELSVHVDAAAASATDP